MAHTDRDNFKTIYKGSASDDALVITVAESLPESYMAADVGERYLLSHGIPGESFVELVFNGDSEPHTFMFLLDDQRIGIWNTDAAQWPIYYPPSDEWGDQMLDGIPWEELENKLNAESESHEENEDGTNLDLGSEETDDENDSDNNEAEDEEEDSDDTEESENGSDDPEEDDDEASQEGDEEAEEPEDSPGDEDSDEDGDEEEEEPEMPRLKLFAKMRGPKGWRKRAEAEELLDRNVFGFKVGALIEDEELTAAQQEKNLIAHVEFIETDEDRKGGLIRMRLPKGVSLDDFKMTGGDWITVAVPYPREED